MGAEARKGPPTFWHKGNVVGPFRLLGPRRRSPLTVHLKPYWGKPAVRNFRGGRGNPKLNRARRAPLPYSALVSKTAHKNQEQSLTPPTKSDAAHGTETSDRTPLNLMTIAAVVPIVPASSLSPPAPLPGGWLAQNAPGTRASDESRRVAGATCPRVAGLRHVRGPPVVSLRFHHSHSGRNPAKPNSANKTTSVQAPSLCTRARRGGLEGRLSARA